jgi:hypothetical protein
VIVVMDHGVIIETGTHDELVAQRGMYCAMAARQDTSVDEAAFNTVVGANLSPNAGEGGGGGGAADSVNNAPTNAPAVVPAQTATATAAAGFTGSTVTSDTAQSMAGSTSSNGRAVDDVNIDSALEASAEAETDRLAAQMGNGWIWRASKPDWHLLLATSLGGLMHGYMQVILTNLSIILWHKLTFREAFPKIHRW